MSTPYTDRLKDLQSSILKRRSIHEELNLPYIPVLNAIKGISYTQTNYIIYVLANYLVVALELIVLQCFLSVFADINSLNILRLISLFSLLPIFLFFACGKSKQISLSAGNKFSKSNLLSEKEIDLGGARVIFSIKSLFAFCAAGYLYNSDFFVHSVPDLVQAIILARLLSAPMESICGFLFLRGYKITTHPLILSRKSTILFDIIAISFLLAHMPFVYFSFHLATRLFRTELILRSFYKITLLNLLILDNKQLKNFIAFAGYFIKAAGLPMLAVICSEIIFYRLTSTIAQSGPLHAQLIFLVHTHYHASAIIALRFLRSRVKHFRITGGLYDAKSQTAELSSWRNITIVSVLAAAPVALIAALPFIQASAFSPSGEIELPARTAFIWPFFTGLSHSLLTVIISSCIKRNWFQQTLVTIILLLFLLLTPAISTQIGLLKLSEENAFSFVLLTDSLLHMLISHIIGLIIIKIYLKPKIIPSALNLSDQGASVLKIKWRKGIFNRKIIIRKAFKTEMFTYFALSKNRAVAIFNPAHRFDLTQVKSNLAVFAENIDYQKAESVSELLAMIKKGLESANDKSYQHSDYFQISSKDGKFNLLKIKSAEYYIQFRDYLHWVARYGFSMPFISSKTARNLKVICSSDNCTVFIKRQNKI